MKNLTLIKQPPDSHLCGQACVAMLANVSLEESISCFGHKEGTFMQEVVSALSFFDIKWKPIIFVDNRKKYELPPVCLVFLGKRGNGLLHLVLHYHGFIYDPEGDVYTNKEELIRHYYEVTGYKYRVQSYVEVVDSDSRQLAPTV